MLKTGYEKFFDLNGILENIRDYLSGFDEKKFIRAFEFAAKAHKGQFRRDGITPYIAHPVEVVRILNFLHADEDTLISALLHDVPEDTPYTIEEIRKIFGDTVAFLVDGITKLSKVHYQHNMPERQVESLKKLFLHSGKDLRVILIKLADRLHNMKTLENIKDFKKRSRIATETLEIYVPVANLLGIQDLKSQLEDLCFKYLFPSEYEKLYKNRKLSEDSRKDVIEKFIDMINGEARKQHVKVKITGQKKNFYSIYKKIRALGKNVEDIDDRVAILVLVETIEDCYKILGIIHCKFIPINDRFRDYIANPKANGYQSIHTTVFGVKGALTEIRICNEKMYFEAEYGMIASFLRGEQTGIDTKKYSWINKILELEKESQVKDSFLKDLKLDILQDRIFVFSPKGTAVDLPKGASVLDFAYAIHSDLGNHASKADINGKIKPISTTLKTGDVINIISSKKISPELSWLSFTKTNLARNKIFLYLRRISKEKKIREGHKILQKEFDIAGLGLCENLNLRKLNKGLMTDYEKTFKNLDELFVSVGEGEIGAVEIVKLLDGNLKFLESSSGGKKPEDLRKGIKVSLKLAAKNRFGLLRDIADVLYSNVLDMYSLKGWASRYEEDAFFTAEILVADLETVSHIFDELKQVEGVVSVCRVSTKGILLFNIGIILISLVWIFHPYGIKLISNSSLQDDRPLLAGIIIYSGLFVLISMVLYLITIVQKYFPFIRKRKLLWIIVFLIPLLASTVLFLELFYFRLKLSILIICIEIILIYAYLVMSYINFRKITRQI